MKVINITVLLAVLVLFGTCAYAADCNNGGRYEDNNNGTVTDCRTGLVWLKNAKCSDQAGGVTPSDGNLSWHDAMKWAAELYGDGTSGPTVCSLTDGSSRGDWRLPTKTEWMAMIQSAKNQTITNPALTNDAGTAVWASGAGSSFTYVQSDCYWSGTSDTDLAWSVDMGSGYMNIENKTAYTCYVWPVRGGQSASFGTVRIE
jgi:hypothetical protein